VDIATVLLFAGLLQLRGGEMHRKTAEHYETITRESVCGHSYDLTVIVKNR
jgi:hypothetical protein